MGLKRTFKGYKRKEVNQDEDEDEDRDEVEEP